MVKGFYIIPLFLFTSLFAQVPNHSFENWGVTDPDGWQTTNIPIVPQSILQDTGAYSGNYCVHGMVVSNNFNQPFAPYLGYSGPSAQGFGISIPYTHLEGYCKLNLLHGDLFSGIVHIYNSSQEPIGEGHFNMTGIVSQWQQFSIDINYDSITTGMSCAMFFTITDSTGLASGHIGSAFWLDYLTMSGVASVDTKQVVNNEFSIFPNPAVDFIRVKFNHTTNDRYSITDVEGRVVGSDYLTGELIALNNLKAGVYFLNIRTMESDYSKKIIILSN